MANNKNQHFVPKAYLKRFASSGGRTINLHVIGKRLSVQSASIKDQCSKHFFYGEEKVFEEFIQYFEGAYGGVMGRLDEGQITSSDLETLLRFLILQYLRTPHMLEQRLQSIEKMQDIEIGGVLLRDGKDTSFGEIIPQREMQHQIYIAAKSSDVVMDLELVLVVNRTKVPFITSDNPAHCMNRLYSQRFRDDTGGLIQSGLLVALPLRPDVLLLGYDRDVYAPIGRGFVFEARNPRDIDRLNGVQVQRASTTIYFSDWDDRDYVERVSRLGLPTRRDSWMRTWTGVLDGEDEQFERYRKIRSEDAGTTATRLTSVSPILAAPPTWPSFLKFKARPRGYSAGSLIGFVRESELKRSPNRGLKPVVIPTSIPRSHTHAGREVVWERKDTKPLGYRAKPSKGARPSGEECED